jgi:molybdopterin synthase catalytic subunit
MISVQTADFDPGAELEQLRLQNHGRAGAVVCFTGLVRDLNDGEKISQMMLEHYPGMTEQVLADLEREAHARWELTATRVIHRVGPLAPDDRIVFVAAASAHRQQAFRACEYLIDTLKTRAPFWKKETTSAGERWVAADPGAQSGRPD